MNKIRYLHLIKFICNRKQPFKSKLTIMYKVLTLGSILSEASIVFRYFFNHLGCSFNYEDHFHFHMFTRLYSKEKCRKPSALKLFVWKVWDFLVARGQKLGARGHQALLEHSAGCVYPQFKIWVILYISIYKKEVLKNTKMWTNKHTNE